MVAGALGGRGGGVCRGGGRGGARGGGGGGGGGGRVPHHCAAAWIAVTLSPPTRRVVAPFHVSRSKPARPEDGPVAPTSHPESPQPRQPPLKPIHPLLDLLLAAREAHADVVLAAAAEVFAGDAGHV